MQPENATNTRSLSALSESIEIPDSAYEQAKSRYRDLGEWLGRPESTVHHYDPEVFPQGSFLLGTVTRPPDANGGYDLDLAVKLRHGVSKTTHTQRELKIMIGKELDHYCRARGIQKSLDEKRRCWRLQYQDQLSFHIDVVPCIPEDEHRREMIKEAMTAADTGEDLADGAANLTVSITDTEHPDYYSICLDWNVSNPQGYVLWFTSRVRQAKQTVEMTEKRAEVTELPTYRLKAPLQRCVQILKLHRDLMFKDDPERAPISIIITTLAARAYQGQEDVGEALLHIVNTMGDHINDRTPRVPNPVNPDEDFSDKWDSDQGQDLGLEENFWRWLYQAQADFAHMAYTKDVDDLAKLATALLGVNLDTTALREKLGRAPEHPAKAEHGDKLPTAKPQVVIKNPPKPWAAKEK